MDTSKRKSLSVAGMIRLSYPEVLAQAQHWGVDISEAKSELEAALLYVQRRRLIGFWGVMQNGKTILVSVAVAFRACLRSCVHASQKPWFPRAFVRAGHHPPSLTPGAVKKTKCVFCCFWEPDRTRIYCTYVHTSVSSVIRRNLHWMCLFVCVFLSWALLASTFRLR